MFARIMKLNMLYTLKLIFNSVFESTLYYAFWCAAYLFANYYHFDFISMTLGFIICFVLSFVDMVRRSISTRKVESIVVQLLIIAYFAIFSENLYRTLVQKMALESELPTYFMMLFGVAILLKLIAFVLEVIVNKMIAHMWKSHQSDFTLDRVITTKDKQKKKVYLLKKLNIYSIRKIVEPE